MRKLAEKADALLALHQLQTHAIAASSVAAGNVQPATDAGDDTVAAASAAKGGQGGKKKKKRSGHPRRRSRSPADFKSPFFVPVSCEIRRQSLQV
jgi:hypothetical protein